MLGIFSVKCVGNGQRQQSIAVERNKLGAKLHHLYSTFIHVWLTSLRTPYTLFTVHWTTIEGSMNGEWGIRGGKETS